ncbi:MAG: efflux transporter outer membrane subunit [Thermoguttaceae bacterium]|nr:efflux transporter outer membrane subunit [Thermoguttaceae bacterium]
MNKKRALSKLFLLTTILLAAISGCKVGPDYQRPGVYINSDYTQLDSEKGVTNNQTINLTSWWDQFNDPTLSALIQMGVSDNLSLKQYATRIYQYQAQIGVVRSDIFPSFRESGMYNYNKGVGSESQSWSLSTDMSWELDFFGRLQRLTEAAVADMEQQNEIYRDAQVILIAEIAQNYVNARLYEQQIRIAKENIAIQKHTVELTEKKQQLGTASKLDGAQARGSCAGVESDLATYEAQYQKALNNLSVLTGRTPGSIDQLFAQSAPIPTAPNQLMVGIPAELLRNRPDVRAAEQALIAQTSRVGAAIGDLYPRFSLTGSFGIDAMDLATGFSSGLASNIGPSFQWNIFAFGKYRSNISVQEFRQSECVLSYQNTVLTAAREVDDALAVYVNEKDRLAKLDEAVVAYDEALQLAQQRYSDGTADFQRVLDTQANKLRYDLQQVQCQANLVNSVIALYKALGGGYRE